MSKRCVLGSLVVAGGDVHPVPGGDVYLVPAQGGGLERQTQKLLPPGLSVPVSHLSVLAPLPPRESGTPGCHRAHGFKKALDSERGGLAVWGPGCLGTVFFCHLHPRFGEKSWVPRHTSGSGQNPTNQKLPSRSRQASENTCPATPAPRRGDPRSHINSLARPPHSIGRLPGRPLCLTGRAVGATRAAVRSPGPQASRGRGHPSTPRGKCAASPSVLQIRPGFDESQSSHPGRRCSQTRCTPLTQRCSTYQRSMQPMNVGQAVSTARTPLTGSRDKQAAGGQELQRPQTAAHSGSRGTAATGPWGSGCQVGLGGGGTQRWLRRHPLARAPGVCAARRARSCEGSCSGGAEQVCTDSSPVSHGCVLSPRRLRLGHDLDCCGAAERMLPALRRGPSGGGGSCSTPGPATSDRTL